MTNQTNENVENITVANEVLHNKSMFTFFFDSGYNVQLTEYVPVFEKYNIQCGFRFGIQEMFYKRENPIHWSNLNDVYYLHHSKGYSLITLPLSHVNLSQENETNDYIAYPEIIGGKNAFEKIGFPVNGFGSTAGVTNKKYKPLLKNFSYAFDGGNFSDPDPNMYLTKASDPYSINGIHLNSDINKLKALIDNTIFNDGFVAFYAHDEITAEKLEEVISYIISKNGTILPPDNAVSNYFGVFSQTVNDGVTVNFMDKTYTTQNIATSQLWKMYVPNTDEFIYDNETRRLTINTSFSEQEIKMFYITVPLSVFSSKDYSQQLLTNIRAFEIPVTNYKFNIRLRHQYEPKNDTKYSITNGFEKGWRTPNTYKLISFPRTENREGIVRVIIEIQATKAVNNLTFEISDIIIGIK